MALTFGALQPLTLAAAAVGGNAVLVAAAGIVVLLAIVLVFVMVLRGNNASRQQRGSGRDFDAQRGPGGQPQGGGAAWQDPQYAGQDQRYDQGYDQQGYDQGYNQQGYDQGANQGRMPATGQGWGGAQPAQDPWGAPAAQAQDPWGASPASAGHAAADANPWGAPASGAQMGAAPWTDVPASQGAWGAQAGQAAQANPWGDQGGFGAQPSAQGQAAGWGAQPQPGQAGWGAQPQPGQPAPSQPASGAWGAPAQDPWGAPAQPAQDPWGAQPAAQPVWSAPPTTPAGSQPAAGAWGGQPAATPAAPVAGAPRGAGPVLVEESGKNPGMEYPVRKDRITIGRHRDSDIFLEDLAVSRLHTTIMRDASGQCVLRDENSANGTFVNGQKVAEQPLRDGDKVQVGQTTLIFHNR
ncbi:MAG TPA: FHA domain-containing protein [Ktedonobacterales bacterium]